MHFRKKTYTVKSEKIKRPFRCVLVSDLHSADRDDYNRSVLCAVSDSHPDIILCPGDIIIGRGDVPCDRGLDFMSALTHIAPVFFSNGNHETELRKYSPALYENFYSGIRSAGVHVLNNRSEHIMVKDNPIWIYGLELGLNKYRKFRIHHMSEKYLTDRIGVRKADGSFQLLLAHNPIFGDLYYRWGADLIVSGHYHGGLLRSPFSGRAMMSPYGFYYPKHGYGQYIWCDDTGTFRNTSDLFPVGENVPYGTNMITSSGLGDHEVPIRIFNPHELVCIDIKEG